MLVLFLCITKNVKQNIDWLLLLVIFVSESEFLMSSNKFVIGIFIVYFKKLSSFLCTS